MRATVDALANRSALLETMEQAYDPQRPCSLIMVDIDDFAHTHARIGQSAGNELLVAVGERLRTVADTSIVGRVGGRFIVFQEQTRGRQLAHAFVETVRAPIPVTEALTAENLISVTISVGVALGPDHGSTLTDLFHSAEHALGSAKSAGGDRAQCSLLRSLYAYEVLPASRQLAATMRQLIGILSDDHESRAWLKSLVAAYEGARTGGRSEFIALGELQFTTAAPEALQREPRCVHLRQRIQDLSLILARSASGPTDTVS